MADRVPSAANDRLRLRRIMQAAAARARAELLDPPGGTENAKRFAEARAAARLKDLENDLRGMSHAAQNVFHRQVVAQSERGVARADRLARDAGLVRDDAPVIGGLTGAETARAGVLSRDGRVKIANAFDSIKDVAGRSIREARALGWDNKKVKRALAGGAIDGVSGTALKRLRELAESVKIDGYVEVPVKGRGGRVIRYKPAKYADLVYQTAMAEAANIATVERLVARQSYYVMIIGSDSKNFCTAFKGKVYYIGPGKDPLGRYPNLSVLPRGGAPFHPRCTKRYVPFNPAAATAAELDAALPTPETTALHGKVESAAQATFEQQRDGDEKLPDRERPPRAQPATGERTPGMTDPEKKTSVPSLPATLIRVADPVILPAPGGPPGHDFIVSSVRRVLDLANGVHGLPPAARPVPVSVVEGLEPNGRIVTDKARARALAWEMRPGNLAPHATAAHELGHYVEIEAFGGIGSSYRLAAFAEWRRRYTTSPTYFALWRRSVDRRDKLSVYYASAAEIFARCYAQWLSVRAGDAVLATELVLGQVGLELPTLWPAAEFEPIADAFGDVFAKAGLLR